MWVFFMSDDISMSQRQAFIRLTPEISETLREMKPLAEKLLPEVLKGFYVHLSRFPEVSEFFSTAERIDFASNRQFQHWQMILDGTFSGDYLTSVKQIGAVHARIGLEPQYYLSGYAFIMDEMIEKLTQHFTSRSGLTKKDLEKVLRLRT